MRGLWFLDFTYWLTWVSLAIGLGVGWLVYMASGYILPARRRRAQAVAEEDLPWDDLLESLKSHKKGDGGELPEGWEDLSPDELLKLVIVQKPGADHEAKAPLPDEDMPLPPGAERRRSRRRWNAPVDVRITAPFHEKPLHGIVVNRSTGGVAVLTDTELAPGTIIFVRAAEAPSSVPSAELLVRHSRAAGKLWLMGCQYKKEVPWSVKVWFG
jgi:hypothetical protein